MKGKFLLLLSVLVSSACIAQNNKKDVLHTVAQKPLKLTAATTTPNTRVLIAQLQRTSSVPAKTDLLYEIASTYLSSLKIDSALYYTKKIKEISDSAGYEAGLGKYYLAKGTALYYRNGGAEVSRNLHEAITIFSKYKNSLFLGVSYHQLARQLTNTEKFADARELYRQAIALIAPSGDAEQLYRVVINTGRNFLYMLEMDSAAYHLAWAMKLGEALKSEPKIFNAASMLGSVYLLTDNVDKAEQILEYALAVKPSSVDKIQLRGAWANYAEALLLNGKHEAAAKAIKEYDELNVLFGDVSGVLAEKKLKGGLQHEQGNYEAAYKLLQDAYRLRIKNPLSAYDLISIATMLGKTEIKTGRIDSAIVHFRLAINTALQSNYIAGVLENQFLLAEGFQQNKQPDSAYHYFKQYAHLKDSILSFKKEQTILELSAQYDAEKREQQIQNLKTAQDVLAYRIALNNKTIEQQQLLDLKKSQQLTLLTQQAEINRLQASEQNLALANKEKEFVKKQQELELSQKEKQLQVAVAENEAQQKKTLAILTGAVLLLGVYGWYRSRQNKKLSNRLAQSLTDLKEAQEQLIKTEKEKEAENIRLRISRDIHDEVGATLSGVALYSEIAKQKMEDHQDKAAAEYLQYISDNSKEMVEKMSDIIWTINPKNDSFERMIFKLQSYAMNLCGGKGIQLHFDIDEVLRSYNPSMQVRKNSYLLMKEAINNAVKYSGAQNIFLSIKKEKGSVQMRVRDDGDGFLLAETGSGNGIANMEARAKEIDAHLSIDTLPGKGTLISLVFQVHPIEVQV